MKILWLRKWFSNPPVILNFSTWAHCRGCCFSRNVFNIVVCVKALRQYLNFTPEKFISVKDASETPLIELQHPDSTQTQVNNRLRRPLNLHFQARYLTCLTYFGYTGCKRLIVTDEGPRPLCQCSPGCHVKGP